MYSRCIYICPFYEHREKLSIRCEGGELRFPDGEATSDHVERYCAAEQWEKCCVAGMLLRYYDRIEDEDQRMRENSHKKWVDVFRYFRLSREHGSTPTK